MRLDSRIILILGLGGDAEAELVRELTTERDTLLLESPFESDSDAAVEPIPHVYFRGAPAVQRVSLHSAGALQQVADTLDRQHGRLDLLILGTRSVLPTLPAASPWRRLGGWPDRSGAFDRLAALTTCLPLLRASSSPLVIELESARSVTDHAWPLWALLEGSGIRHECRWLSPYGDQDLPRRPACSREPCGMTTL
ncbi:hypothetical protein [Salinicola rhizosphaerae]|uniref:Tetrapyrrole methylase domain-containing protein n=1 Tax=Salinicola rhizosphaerae TaxID=1443141 RepID=A0ABQ3EGV7_9GAMM|nr:hypothetical protein [Salinicola rhizosphaerae]GHB34314.1 hypothetical protein GCM10009038_36780 [Salinicola rhizosphaerae]